MQASFHPSTPFVRLAVARPVACLVVFVLFILAVVQPAHAEDDFLPPEQAFPSPRVRTMPGRSR
jgi:hypothetical protein